MAGIAILYCERIKDVSCIACAKCFKAVDRKDGEFSSLGDDRIDEMKAILAAKFGVKVVLGTHPY